MADGKVDKREEELFTTISHQLGLDESVRIDVAAQNSLLALCDIRDFDISQKEEFAKMMGRMIVIDNDINYDEVRIYNVVNEFCDIKIEFNPDYIITQM